MIYQMRVSGNAKNGVGCVSLTSICHRIRLARQLHFGHLPLKCCCAAFCRLSTLTRLRPTKKEPTGLAGGSSYAPERLKIPAAPEERITTCSCIGYLQPVNGSKSKVNWLSSASCFNWFLIYCDIFCVFLPVVST